MLHAWILTCDYVSEVVKSKSGSNLKSESEVNVFCIYFWHSIICEASIHRRHFQPRVFLIITARSVIWSAHEHGFRYTDYDIILRDRGRKCSYFLITHNLYCRNLLKPWSRSFTVTDGCFTEPGPLWYRWSRQKPVARFKQPGNLTVQATAAKHAGQVWLCASQRSISHRGASAIKCFWKVNAQPLQSKVTDSHGRLRPPPRCDCCFKELSDSLTSLYSAAAAPLRCKLHLLPSPLSSLLFSFLSHSD